MPARPSRRLRYQVATSLDGYIAGPGGEADWIPMDPDIDFGALFAQFDTLLMGRRTFEALVAQGNAGEGGAFGLITYVVSRTLSQTDHPGVTVVGDTLVETIAALKATPGKDIWLFGGGDLFLSLAALGLVDTVELAICPVLLGAGLPVLRPTADQISLELTGHRVYPKSGIVLLEYQVKGTRAAR